MAEKQYDNTNRIALWKPSESDIAEFHQRVPDGTPPVLKGHGEVDGVEVWANAYRPKSQSDKSPYLVVKVSPKDGAQKTVKPAARNNNADTSDLDSDIPF